MKLGTVSVDLDNLWCYQRSFGFEQWRSYPSFLETAIPRILKFLTVRGLTATFFVVGKDATNPNLQVLLKSIVDSGHEVANHSFYHDENFHQSSEQHILAELTQAHQAIKNATGYHSVGFRGPAYGLSDALIASLITLDYQYDASTFPNSIGALARWYQQSKNNKIGGQAKLSAAKFGKLSGAWASQTPKWITHNNRNLLEIPVTTSAFARIPCHGTYLHFLADRSPLFALVFFKIALFGYSLAGVSPSFVLHATDFLGKDDDYELSYIPGMKRSSTEKIDFMHKVFTQMQGRFSLIGLGAFQAQFGQCAK